MARAAGLAMRMHHVHAARARDSSFAFSYTPTGRPLDIDLRKLSGERVIAHCFDPREGKRWRAGHFGAEGPRQFSP